MFDYPVTLTPDQGTVMVTFTDVPEAITFGMDEDEALLQAVDALESALTFYIEDRKLLPTPSKPATTACHKWPPVLPTVRSEANPLPAVWLVLVVRFLAEGLIPDVLHVLENNNDMVQPVWSCAIAAAWVDAANCSA